MAEGGYDAEMDDPLHPHDGDDDFDEQEVDRTHPFQPGDASTLYHGGEEIEMQMHPHETSGLPETYFDETTQKAEDLRSEWSALPKKLTICTRKKCRQARSI